VLWDTKLDTSIYDVVWQDSTISSTYKICEGGEYFYTIVDKKTGVVILREKVKLY
jgi:hypothetical protein